MRLRALVVAVAVGLLTAADKPKDDAKADQDKLQGTWVCVSAEEGGMPAPEEKVKSFKFTFMGDKLTFENGDKKHEGTFKLDPAKKPRELTIKPDDEDKELKAIYAFEGDTLKLCGAEPGGDRPESFTTKEGDRRMLFVVKRAKP